MKFLIILVILKVIFAFDSNHICEKEQLNCTGYYDFNHNFKTECKPFDCFGQYGYECEKGKCAISKKSCDFYLALSSNLMRAVISPSKYKVNLRKHEKYLKSIKSCESPNKEWQPKDVCIRLNDCIQKHTHHLLEKSVVIKKKIDCLCDQKHHFECNKQYCAVNKEACDTLAINIAQNSSIKTRIQKCTHQTKIIERKFSF